MFNQINVLRKLGYIEGLSYLALVGVAMPLKYLAGMPQAVRIVGMAHGILFVLYVMQGIKVALECDWPLRKIIMLFVAAILPFGPFVFDRTLHVESPGVPNTSP